MESLFGGAQAEKFARKHAKQVKEDDSTDKKPSDIQQKQQGKKKKKKRKLPEVSEGGEGGTLDTSDSLEATHEIFVGNLPLATRPKEIERIFKKFGAVASVRLRSVPIAGTAVDDAGNLNLVKRVCANKRKYSDNKNSVNAYVSFVDGKTTVNKDSNGESSAEQSSSSLSAENAVRAAIAANGMQFNGHILRIDVSLPSGKSSGLFDPKRSVFLGNLPHRVTEEEVRKHFSDGLAGIGDSASNATDKGTELIQGVRLVRDSETQLGKGFGYLLLRDRSTAAAALELNDTKISGR